MRSLALLLALPLVLPAQSSSKGREILESAITALGGKAFLSMQNRVEKGRLYSFYREQLNGLARATVYTKYEQIDGGFGIRERQSFGKDKEDYAYLYTDKEAVQVNFRGVRPLPPGQHERYLDTMQRNLFYLLRYRMDELGMVFEFKESAVIDNNPVDVVDITDAENRVVTAYIHKSTHLPVKQLTVRRDPDSKRRIEEATIFNKYRESNGIQWPWSIVRFRDGNRIFEMYSESVEMNESKLDADLFTPPMGAKRLKPL